MRNIRDPLPCYYRIYNNLEGGSDHTIRPFIPGTAKQKRRSFRPVGVNIRIAFQYPVNELHALKLQKQLWQGARQQLPTSRCIQWPQDERPYRASTEQIACAQRRKLRGEMQRQEERQVAQKAVQRQQLATSFTQRVHYGAAKHVAVWGLPRPKSQPAEKSATTPTHIKLQPMATK